MEIRPEDLAGWDRVVMVDVQPPHLRRPLPRVDAVVDHHPAQTSYDARYIDVRNHYGATATILLEYLRAEGIKDNERLAVRFQVRDVLMREWNADNFSNHIHASVAVQISRGGKSKDADLDGVRNWLDKHFPPRT